MERGKERGAKKTKSPSTATKPSLNFENAVFSLVESNTRMPHTVHGNHLRSEAEGDAGRRQGNAFSCSKLANIQNPLSFLPLPLKIIKPRASYRSKKTKKPPKTKQNPTRLQQPVEYLGGSAPCCHHRLSSPGGRTLELSRASSSA